MGTQNPQTRVANTIQSALSTKQPLEVNGKAHIIMLTDLRDAPVKDRLLLSLAATHGTEHHLGDLLIRRRRFADSISSPRSSWTLPDNSSRATSRRARSPRVIRPRIAVVASLFGPISHSVRRNPHKEFAQNACVRVGTRDHSDFRS